MKQLIIPAALALLMAACSSTPDSTDQTGAPVETRGGGPAVATVTTGGVESGRLPAVLTDPKSILSKRSVFFDYDSYVVKDEYRALVDAHAKYLQANRGAKVTMQGHTDERGTREYNIALGQRRADAVKKMMLLLGATEMQIETVSFGEEKPRNPASGEAAWADNRRVEIVHAGE